MSWSWIKKLRSPSATRSVLFLTGTGIVIGVAGMIAFDATMHATNTEEFCISCHEMEDNAFAQLKKTSQYHNAAGVSASCSD